MFQAFDQNQTRFVVAPWAPQLSVTGAVTPGTVKVAVSTFSADRMSPVAMSLPHVRSTNCSPRLKTLVWVQPTGRGAAAAAGPTATGDVRLVVVVFVTVSWALATGNCTNWPFRLAWILIRTLKLTVPAA